MPQLLNANGRRSGGRQAASAVNDAARGSNANKRGMAGRVFEKGEFRPTSLRHFLASSSTLRIAAGAPMAVIVLLHWLSVRDRSATTVTDKSEYF